MVHEILYNNKLFRGPHWACAVLRHSFSKSVFSRLCAKYNIPRSKIYLDCGAAFGSETVQYHDTFEEIHAFEPDKQNYGYLSNNTIRYYDNIKIHNVALNSFTGKTGFYSYVNGSGLGSINSAGVRKKELVKRRRTLIPCFTMDSFNFTDVGFIKIDVEGAEKHVLLGAIETLDKNSPLLRVEITNEHKDVLDILKSLGYNPIGFDCAGFLYYLDDSFEFIKFTDGETYWSCDNISVQRSHLTWGRRMEVPLPIYPQGMNPCQGDFWFYKT